MNRAHIYKTQGGTENTVVDEANRRTPHRLGTKSSLGGEIYGAIRRGNPQGRRSTFHRRRNPYHQSQRRSLPTGVIGIYTAVLREISEILSSLLLRLLSL